MYLVEVVLPISIDKKFHYVSSIYIEPGTRVIVPFGRQKTVGMAYSICELSPQLLSPNLEYKSIEDILDDFPLYPKELFSFLEWVSHYYLCPLGILFKIALPTGTFKVPSRKIILTEKGRKALKEGVLPPALEELLGKKLSLNSFLKKSKIQRKKIKDWEKLEFIKIISELPKLKVDKEIYYRIKKRLPDYVGKEINYLFEEALELPESKVKEVFKRNLLEKLVKEGYLEKLEFPKMRKISLPYNMPKNYVLTSSQRKVFEELKEALITGEFQPFLLYGVTGSGKSLIYLELIKEALSLNKKVLFLLPEIALTHSMERLLYQFFKDEIALLHSTLSPQQRFSEWIKILEGKAKIILGTRSAIFAPVKDLGLIIVDEEHDPSYKEENLPCRYNARDLALIRAQREKALVVLGSATPSIKSYFFAKKGKYKLITLKERPFVKMPITQIITNHSPFLLTKEVQREVEKTLQSGKSVFLYLNRRGYAPLVQCSQCYFTINCPNCGIPLTYHKDIEAAMCHYCNFSAKINILCPQCKAGKWRFLRYGTERIEEEIKKIFSGVEVIRFDKDVVSSEKRLKELLDKLYSFQPKIIVGTQMGVHGHNFPQVNLVVILRAEEGLLMPHYKSYERTFQLLLQAEGRAGRENERGKVLIQTALPEHYVIKYALKQDYEAFYHEEILRRKKYEFPPFKKLAVIYFEGTSEEKVVQRATSLKEKLEALKTKENLGVTLLGPSPCPFKKLRGIYRWQILMKGNTSQELHKLFNYLKELHLTGVKTVLDIDPETLL